MEPESVIVDYGSYLLPPTISGIPEEKVAFEGWYTPTGQSWLFDTEETANAGDTPMAVEKDLTLIAHWRDEALPGITNITRKTYNTFEFTAEDTLGISGYALVKVSSLETEVLPPSEEAWIEIPTSIKVSQLLSVEAAGTYRLWVKDTVGNFANETITAYSISLDVSTGISQAWFIEQLAGTTTQVTGFALEGTKLTISITLDSHYESLILNLNGAQILNGVEYEVTEPLVLSAACAPKTYTVEFATGREGVTIPVQTITYLHKAERPLALYHQGYIINNWYRDPELTQLWNFDTQVIEGDITLYAG